MYIYTHSYLFSLELALHCFSLNRSAQQPQQEGVCSWPPESLGPAASPVSWRCQVRAHIPHSWGENLFWILSCFFQKCALTGHGCHSSVATEQHLVLDLQSWWEQVCASQQLAGNETFPHLRLITWGNAQLWTETPTEFRCLQVGVEGVSRHCQ